MSGATIVDQLIVKLGLDPRDFAKGQKTAAAEIVKTEQSVKRSSDNMGRSIMQFTGKLLGVATAVQVVRKTAGYVSDLSTTVRQLGIDARNAGLAANELRNYQNLSEMFGGKREEATRTITNLTKAVYDLAYNGTVSDSLIMLGRLGVQFQDSAGHARNFNDVMSDTEQRVQSLMSSGKLTYENANQMLGQAGFDPGLSQAILSGQMSSYIAQQKNRRQVDGGMVSGATQWEMSAANRDQAVEAAAQRTLPAAGAAGAAINNKIAEGAEALGDADFKSALEDIGKLFSETGDRIKQGADKLVDSLEDFGQAAKLASYPKGRESYESTIQHAAKKYGVDPEMLAGVLATESDFDPAAKSSAGAVGIAQLMPKYFPGAGKNPDQDIHTAAAYLQALRDNYKQKGYSEDDAYYYAFQSYNAGQSRVQKAMNGGPPLKQETLDYPNKVLSYAQGAQPTPGAAPSAGAAGSNTTVTIGKVDINTQATDADGIAKDFAGSTRRKMIAAQSDAGMQ